MGDKMKKHTCKHQKYLLKLFKTKPEKFFARYENLHMTPDVANLLYNHTMEFISNCNGVGSPEGGKFKRFIWKITPDTIWGLDITPTADLHDNGYTVPLEFRDLQTALKHKVGEDILFKKNVKTQIARGTWLLRWVRNRRVWKYALALVKCGQDAFIENKIIGGLSNG